MNVNDIHTNGDRVATTLGTRHSRRTIMMGLGGGLASALAVATMGSVSAHHTSQLYTVSANANFRSGPGTNYSKLGVISAGAKFQINHQVQNGYAGIIHNGTNGWVLASLVVPAGTPSTPQIVGVGWTTSSVRLRTGPGTSYATLLVVPSSAEIGISDTVTDGFRYVKYSGQTGWMADAYIDKDAGDGPVPSYVTTTANLNLRAEPSTSAPILLVVPSGSKVVPNGAMAYGYAQVTYNGVKGWVLAAYLT